MLLLIESSHATHHHGTPALTALELVQLASWGVPAGCPRRGIGVRFCQRVLVVLRPPRELTVGNRRRPGRVRGAHESHEARHQDARGPQAALPREVSRLVFPPRGAAFAGAWRDRCDERWTTDSAQTRKACAGWAGATTGWLVGRLASSDGARGRAPRHCCCARLTGTVEPARGSVRRWRTVEVASSFLPVATIANGTDGLVRRAPGSAEQRRCCCELLSDAQSSYAPNEKWVARGLAFRAPTHHLPCVCRWGHAGARWETPGRARTGMRDLAP